MSSDWTLGISTVDDISSVKQQDARDATDTREDCTTATAWDNLRGYGDIIQRFYYRKDCNRAEVHVTTTEQGERSDYRYNVSRVYPSLIAARNRFTHGDEIRVIKRRSTVYLLRKGTPLHPDKQEERCPDIPSRYKALIRKIAEETVTDFVRGSIDQTTITEKDLADITEYPYPFDRFVNALRYQRKNITNGSVRISQTDTTVTLTRTSPYLSLLYRRDK